MDIASSIQAVTEEVVIRLTRNIAMNIRLKIYVWQEVAKL